MTKQDLLTKIRAYFLSTSQASREQAMKFYKKDIDQLENEADKERVVAEIEMLYQP